MAETYPRLYYRDAEIIASVIFNEIAAALVRGDRVELRGFGAFAVRHRDARTGRNPRTGSEVQVAEKRRPFFKIGEKLTVQLNPEGQAAEPRASIRRGKVAYPFCTYILHRERRRISEARVLSELLDFCTPLPHAALACAPRAATRWCKIKNSARR